MTSFNSSDNENNVGSLVSVGIPAYNRPEGLRQTLECITKQTYKNLQIVVSNNCSPNPDVEKVMMEYAAKDKRILPFTQLENIGPGENWDFLLKKSIGEYFMWAADDDYWETEFIEVMVRLLQTNEQSVAAFCAVRACQTSQIFDYLDKYSDLSSPDINKRLSAYLSWPEGQLGKGSIPYSLHKRENIIVCQEKMRSYCSDIKNFSPDILLVYNMLIRGSIVFSRSPLYTVTLSGVYTSYTSYVYTKKNFVGASIFLFIVKWCNLLFRREKFYFTVSKTIWQSEASIFCFFYSLIAIVTRHFRAVAFLLKNIFFRTGHEKN